MSGQEKLEGTAKKSLWSDLAPRFVSALVLAIAAFAVTYWGGAAFALFFCLVVLLVYHEWVLMVGESRTGLPALIGHGCIIASLLALFFGFWQAALIIPLIGSGFLWLARCSHARARWCGWGLLYASAFGLAILSLRADEAYGFAAIILLFALVWGTDVAAYFSGRLIGGPKLWPRVSPKKTWSGSVGGLVVGTALALGAASVFGIEVSVKLTLLLAALSILSQLGDLAESHMKRLFDVKDSSNLIPGHGGVMDRVDGLLVAVVFAALFGLAFGEGNALASGFLIW
ncbi:MAG: phosphatidate cytidylyltransferase [Cohaesibacter sp.]|nr:phosphatidate cytidylyltransferase [Cohaesibacter sp.]MCV6602883.1 phosphatidate cytidylyltransferase [Cohaesibacter sp.]